MTLPLFRRLLGAAFDGLPEPIRTLHDRAATCVAVGEAEVTRGGSLPARLILAAMRLPRAGPRVPVRVRFVVVAEGERWERDFGGRRMTSTLRATPDGHLVERLGPFAVRFRPVAAATGLGLEPVHWRCAGLPVPHRLAPRIRVQDGVSDGRFTFDVRIDLPGAGLLLAYRGWLGPSRASRVHGRLTPGPRNGSLPPGTTACGGGRPAMQTRRNIMLAGAALAAFPAMAQQQFATMNIFVPAGPGGGWDGLGRAIERAARAHNLVGSFQFTNVGGAGGTVGLPQFAGRYRTAPNALFIGGSVMVGAVLTNRSPIGFQNITPIARMTTEEPVIVVPASSRFQTIAQLVEALRANPREVPIGGGSAGGTDHIALGLMLKALGKSARDASYVAFAGGGPAQAALLGAQVAAGISGYSEFAEQIRAGRLRALATISEARLQPDVPTLRESGVDVAVGNWRGVFAGQGINAAQKEALIKFVTDVRATPTWREIVEAQGWADAFLAGDAFAAYLQQDMAATETILRDIGLIT